MSDMNDLYSALQDAKRVAESLMTWQTNMDGRDRVRAYQRSIEDGIRAYDRLSQQLRDGRKHTEPPPDFKRTTCGCQDPGAVPPCSWCTDPENNPEQEATADAPVAEPVALTEHELDMDQALAERDEREGVINSILDEVLGQDRHEWSSSYGFADAIEDVKTRMWALTRPPAPEEGKDAVLGRFHDDTLRLDWIESNVCDVHSFGGGKLRISWCNGVCQTWVGPGHFSTWREAIDAHRAANERPRYTHNADGSVTSENPAPYWAPNVEAKDAATKPCRSPYCECDEGCCTRLGFHDARHEPTASPTPPR